MSVPRSVDVTQTGAVSIDLAGGAEVAVVVGPYLQTPKEGSIVFVQVFVQLRGMTDDGLVTLQLHRGPTVDGPVVGSPLMHAVMADQPSAFLAVFSEHLANSDYVQYCAGLATEVEGAACVNALMYCESF